MKDFNAHKIKSSIMLGWLLKMVIIIIFLTMPSIIMNINHNSNSLKKDVCTLCTVFN